MAQNELGLHQSTQNTIFPKETNKSFESEELVKKVAKWLPEKKISTKPMNSEYHIDLMGSFHLHSSSLVEVKNSKKRILTPVFFFSNDSYLKK